jgi:glucosyl-3-phosphoglycerate synthase
MPASDALAAICREKRLTISVCLPARDEAATVGAIVESLSSVRGQRGLIDEIVVMDDRSQDATPEVARRAGATVVSTADVLPAYSHNGGKGAAIWKSLLVATGDIVCWLDADVADFDPEVVSLLVAPLLTGEADFAKGHYRRNAGAGALGGGRVTELTAKPLIRRFLPHLEGFPQPLSGEFAGFRSVLERLPFEPGWGVDLGLLADVVELVGADRVAAVDLGSRHHSHRPLVELAPQADAVAGVVLDRCGLRPSNASPLPPIASLPQRAQEAG